MRRPLCLVCMAFVAAVFIMLHIQPMQEHALSEEQEGQVVTRQGIVTAKEYKDGNLILYLEDKDKEGFLCYMSDVTEPKLGSVVTVQGKAMNFRHGRNPGGFDQREYYRVQRVYYQIKNGRLLTQSGQYSFYRESLYRLRRQLERILEQCMEEQDAAVMKAVLLGNKQELDTEKKQLYQKSGIAHVLAISGVHITILGMGLYEALRRLRIPGWLCSVVAIILMLLYGDMVGMSTSAYRAIFMFALKMGAQLLHRTYDMLTALALAAAGVLLEQPLYLYHAGFLLSFGAILGIGCMLDVIKTDMTQMSFKGMGDKAWIYKRLTKIREGLAGGFAVFTVHFPIMLWFYYEFPIYSFLLNLLIIPAMGIVMILGLVCIGFGAFSWGVMRGTAYLAAQGCHLILQGFDLLCEGSLKLPGSTWIVGRPAVWRIVIFYIVIILLYVIHQYLKKERTQVIPYWLKMTWILAAVIMLTHRTYGKLEITVMDVGQGDGIWLETDKGEHYLIDGGSTSESKLARYTLVPFLKYTGTDRLDAVFLTHLDEDHISGVRELLENPQGIRIEQVVIAQAAKKDEKYEALRELCKEKKVPLRHVKSGDYMEAGKMRLQILHPEAEYQAQDRNGYSLVMKLEYGGFHALFTGDVTEDGEMAVARSLPSDWKCHYYKVAHHGSRYSNSELLLNQLQPDIAVISCGENNSYGHPHTEVLERLRQVGTTVYRTDESGAVMLTVSGSQLKMKKHIMALSK